MPETKPTRKPGKQTWKERLKAQYTRFKALQGDPHYIAIGMASGVFVAVTPTIPFHTVLALAFAFVLKGSKPAAVIGAWFCNPLTIGPFYFASYHIGMLLLGREVIVDLPTASLRHLLSLGDDVAIAMVVGGALLGIFPAVLAYFLTFYMFRKIRSRSRRSHAEEACDEQNASDDDSPLPGNSTENKCQP